MVELDSQKYDLFFGESEKNCMQEAPPGLLDRIHETPYKWIPQVEKTDSLSNVL